MNKSERVRLFAVTIILIFIVCLSIYVLVNKDTIFKQIVTITYGDGCVEKYINGELNTSECVEGRRLLEESNNQWNKTPEMPNLTIPIS